MGDTVFVNGRAVVHMTSAGKSIAFPDVCLCPPTPPAGPIPTPLPNNVQAMDLQGGATTVLTEGNPTGKQTSFFMKSTGNEVSQATGGGVVSHATIGKAYFQTFSFDVMFEGEPVVRHLDLLTHNHLAQAPGNTPPVPWLSTQDLPALPPPPLRIKPLDGPGLKLTISTGSGQSVEDRGEVDVSEAGGKPTPTKMGQGKLDHKAPKGPVLVRFHEVRRALWTAPAAAPDEPVDLALLCGGFPDGTKATFEIRRDGHGAEGELVKSLPATIKDNKARVTWTYAQPLGGAATTAFVFVAKVEDKSALAPRLAIVPYPITDVRGVKQRLRARGYDAGPPDASEGGPLEKALEKFQADHEMAVTGKLDAKTRAVIAALFHTGG